MTACNEAKGQGPSFSEAAEFNKENPGHGEFAIPYEIPVVPARLRTKQLPVFRHPSCYFCAKELTNATTEVDKSFNCQR